MAAGVLCCVGDCEETWAQAPEPVQAVRNSEAASWCTVTVDENLLRACRVHGLSEPIAGELAASTPVAFGTFPHLIAAAWAPDGFYGALEVMRCSHSMKQSGSIGKLLGGVRGRSQAQAYSSA